MKNIVFVLFCLGGYISIHAQQLVYKPINPVFGGDTFNYQWLLSSANAQNPFDDDQKGFKDILGDINSMDSFNDSLNRQLLSQLTGKLVDDKFGDGNIKPGKYMFGTLYLDVSEATQGLVINILDTSTGEQSQIIIPR